MNTPTHDKNERPFPLTLSDSGVMLLIEQAQARARVLGFHDETGTLLRRLAEQLLASRSADLAQEGYPGIAHDFETMRSALVQIRDECFNGHAHDIAEAALNAAPQSEGTRDAGLPDAGRREPADAALSPGRPAAVAAPHSSALPTEPPIEALDAMSNGVIFHIVQRAPAPDMGVLRERQRMVWRDVLAALGEVQTPSASRSTEADDKLGMDTRRGGD